MIASIVVAVLAIPVLAVVSIVMAMGTRERISLFVVLVAGTIAIAWRSDAASAAVPATAIVVALVFAHWSLDLDPSEFGLPLGTGPDSPWQPDRFLFGAPLALGAGFALLFGVSGFLAQSRAATPAIAMLWSASAVVAPIAILMMLYWRIAGFDRSIPLAGAALLLAALFALATEALGRPGERPGVGAAGAIFATGAIASLALGLSLALEKGWVAERRPWPALRWLAAAVTFGVLGRIAWDPRIVGDAIGTRPIFNWLLYGYGVPALSFWLGGHLLRRRADDMPARVVDAAAILFTVLLIVLEVRHFVTGDPYLGGDSLAEVGLTVSLLLAMLIGLERLRIKSGSVVHKWGARAIAAFVLYLAVTGLAFDANPLFDGRPVGGPFINLVLLGYGIPAVLAAVLGHVTRDTRPQRI
jgi:uncharacterized membrane protein